MSDTVNKWKERSQYDLETAKVMLEGGRFLYVLFCCQQSIEKALIIQQTGSLAPRIHNLLQLAELAGLEMPLERKRILGELTAYYIQSRYPEEIQEMSSAIRREMAEKKLKKFMAKKFSMILKNH